MQERKRNTQKSRRKKRRLKKGVFVFLFLLIAVLAVLSLTIFFPIGTIQVQGKSAYSEQEIVAASGIKKGDNMFWPLFNGSKNRLKKALPYVKTVSYRYALPGTIILSVTPYTAAYQFQVKGKFVLAAKDGTVLEITDQQQEDLPVILVESLQYELREKISFADTSQEEIYNTLQKTTEGFHNPPNRFDLTDPLHLQLQIGQTVVKLGSHTYLEEKIHMVEKMLEQIPAGEAGTIDVSGWTPENKKASYVKSENT